MTRPRTAWLAFALLGVLDSVLLPEFPIAGVVVVALALAGIGWKPPRAAAVAGFITGIGGTWTGVMVRGKVSCEAFNAVPGQGCEAPGIDSWIVIGIVMLAIGTLATIGVVLRERGQPRT